jgi:hypothetical protein
MTSPKIQNSLDASCACEIIYNIVCDIGDDVYCVLIDGYGDCSGKEQMAFIDRYVDSLVSERFLNIVHVKERNAKSLKEAIQQLLWINGCLSMSFSSTMFVQRIIQNHIA